MAANISGVYKMMAFITVISAIIMVTVLTTFGYLNAMNGKTMALDTDVPLKYIATNEKSINDINGQFSKINEKYASFPVYFVDDADYVYEEIDYSQGKNGSSMVKQRNLILIKQSDYQAFLKVRNIKVNEDVMVSNVKTNCQTKGKDISYCNFINKEAIDIDSIAYSQYLNQMARSEMHFSFLKDGTIGTAKEREDARLYNNLIEPDIIVLKDDNKIFNSLDHAYMTTFNQPVDNNKMFQYYDVFFNSSITNPENVIVLNEIIIAQND